jgi:hypothetical protein
MKTKSIKKFFLFLAVTVSIVVLSCHKEEISFPDPSTLPHGLVGFWVETNHGIDTISFNSNSDTGFFYLSRGFAMKNGYWLPKIGSAPYAYTISGESITVINGLSCSLEGGNYYFKFDEPNLTFNIGKFSKYLDTNKNIMTFRKIK